VEHRAALAARLDRAALLGVQVVAPAAIAGLPSDPGSLPHAVAVVADPNVPLERPLRREVGGRTFWLASPLPVDGSPHRGVSLAAARVTGHLARTR
jgi:hypothetical protein